MLDATVIRILAILMAIGSIVGFVAFRRRHAPRIRPPDVRAEANPPRVLQIVWPTVIAVAALYPWIAALLPQLAYGTILNVSFPLDDVVQLAGFLLWGAGGAVVIWSARALGRFMVLEIVVSKDHELIQTGPYAYVRHPTYAGAMAMAIGASMLFLSVVLVALAALTVILANYRARREERLLSSFEGFGESYKAYMAQTGRFLPRLRI